MLAKDITQHVTCIVRNRVWALLDPENGLHGGLVVHVFRCSCASQSLIYTLFYHRENDSRKV